MIPIVSKHVEVYVFRRVHGRVQVLVLRRSPGHALPGVWQPVTGKRIGRERALVAAAREVREETGIDPIRWWGLETMSMWFESLNERFAMLPIYAAEVAPTAKVVISREHDDFAWLPLRRAGKRFAWETQRRALAAFEREVLKNPNAHYLDRTALLAELEASRPPARRPARSAARAVRGRRAPR